MNSYNLKPQDNKKIIEISKIHQMMTILVKDLETYKDKFKITRYKKPLGHSRSAFWLVQVQ